jgi:hypothetical protein
MTCHMTQRQAPSAVLELTLWQLWASADGDSKSSLHVGDRLLSYLLLQPRAGLQLSSLLVPFEKCVG